MAAATPTKKRSLSRAQTRLVVRMGNEDGGVPDARDNVDYLHATRIEHTAGGQRVNAITLDYDLGKQNEHIIDTLAPKGVNREIEVREIDLQGELKRILGWGKLATQPVSIGETESIQFIARMDKHLFGSPLGKTPFWTPISGGSVLQLDRPLVFNQEVDEIILANRSNKEWSARNDAYVFFDSLSINTATARTYHGQVPAKWRIFEAVHTLCWLLNPDETYITNPTRADCWIDLHELDESTEVLRNLSLRTGIYLPQALDELLVPFGASWTVDTTADEETGLTVRRLRFFRRNHGTKRQLFLARPGEKLVPTKSNVPQLGITYDVANLANKIVGCSSRKQREGTWLLWCCWPTSQDNLDREQLESDPEYAKDYPHAYHKFVLNEHGGWTGLRPEITGPTDLTAHFGGDPTLPTARTFMPCLSRVLSTDSDKLESRGIVVEWLNPDTDAWERVTWGHSNLAQECGIWFEKIPQKLYDAIQADPTTARIRVTATIEGDTKLYKTAGPSTESPNGDDVELRLELGDKFHDKLVMSSSIFYGDSGNDNSDDASALDGYVARILAVEDSAELSVSAILEGIDHPEYQIGDLITSVNGRNLQLNRNNPTPGVPKKYLQIMGITYNIPSGPDSKPQTELLLESFEEEQL